MAFDSGLKFYHELRGQRKRVSDTGVRRLVQPRKYLLRCHYGLAAAGQPVWRTAGGGGYRAVRCKLFRLENVRSILKTRQPVEIRYTVTTVEVLYRGKRVASHARSAEKARNHHRDQPSTAVASALSRVDAGAAAGMGRVDRTVRPAVREGFSFRRTIQTPRKIEGRQSLKPSQ